MNNTNHLRNKMAGNNKNRRKSAGTSKHITSAMPLVFAMNAEQANRLKDIPNKSMAIFALGTAGKQDYTNIHLRLVTGVYIAKAVLHLRDDDASVFMPIKEGLEALRGVLRLAQENDMQKWHMSPGTFAMVDEALDIINQLQDQITRREMAFAWREAQKAIEESFRRARPGAMVPKEPKDQILEEVDYTAKIDEPTETT